MRPPTSHVTRSSPPSWLIWWPVALAGMIFLASSRSHLATPDTVVPEVDKIGHFHVYGLLATLVLRVVFNPARRWRGALIAVICVSLYGITDEFHQSFTPGRGVEFADWLADTGGAILAVTIYSVWPRWRRMLEFPLVRRRPPPSGIASAATSRDVPASAR